mmetsp:Transcript_2611/g.5332  ORF Transcript_2611/g.5332 Transcript_2611/m.5332 type:complete len:240 (+) Transcript_2611:234-953(+)
MGKAVFLPVLTVFLPIIFFVGEVVVGWPVVGYVVEGATEGNAEGKSWPMTPEMSSIRNTSLAAETGLSTLCMMISDTQYPCGRINPKADGSVCPIVGGRGKTMESFPMGNSNIKVVLRPPSEADTRLKKSADTPAPGKYQKLLESNRASHKIQGEPLPPGIIPHPGELKTCPMAVVKTVGSCDMEKSSSIVPLLPNGTATSLLLPKKAGTELLNEDKSSNQSGSVLPKASFHSVSVSKV